MVVNVRGHALHSRRKFRNLIHISTDNMTKITRVSGGNLILAFITGLCTGNPFILCAGTVPQPDRSSSDCSDEPPERVSSGGASALSSLLSLCLPWP